MANGLFKLKGPAILQGKFSPAFPLKHQQKDLRLALALGDEVAQPMPVAAAANEVHLGTLATPVASHFEVPRVSSSQCRSVP